MGVFHVFQIIHKLTKSRKASHMNKVKKSTYFISEKLLKQNNILTKANNDTLGLNWGR